MRKPKTFLFPFLVLLVGAAGLTSSSAFSDGTFRTESDMSHFTGSIHTGLWQTLGSLFTIDNRYCGAPSKSADCPYENSPAPISMLSQDAKGVASAFLMTDTSNSLRNAEKDLADYEQLFAIPKGKPFYSLGPQDVAIENGLTQKFHHLPLDEQRSIQSFYQGLETLKSTLAVDATGPHGERGFTLLTQFPNFFLGGNSSHVFDPQHHYLSEGWLWDAALKHTGQDPVKAMTLLAYCGANEGYRSPLNNTPFNPEDQLVCPQIPWIEMNGSLSSSAEIPKELEAEIIQTHSALGHYVPPGQTQAWVPSKNYHIFASAYVGCQLAAQGHPVDRIVAVERALSSAYRDFTFRNEVCSIAHSPAGQSQPGTVSDDGVALIQQLKRSDSRNIDQKISGLRNSYDWNPQRFKKAKLQVKEWLLDWDWTIAQHEVGARWGAEVCGKK
jgi:hypothetical protein